MDTAKYQQMMYEKIAKQLQKWERQASVNEADLYSFLHALKGTAGSIGLEELSESAAEKLATLQPNGVKPFWREQWQAFLWPIMEALSFYEENSAFHQGELEQSLPQVHEQNFILVIDDDIVFISFLKNVLEAQGYFVVVASDGARGLQLIYELNPALVFLDLMLPDTNGFSILENVRKIKANQLFVALMSVDDSKENRKKAYDLGAFDFIAKPIDAEILLSYVNNRLSYKQALERSIVTDELTNVYNRKYFTQQMERLLTRHENYAEPFTVAILDLDYFKKVNDTYGHLVGDEVLKGFAALVMTEKREQDVFCRYGGEEFILLLPDTTIQEAYSEVERLRKSMSAWAFEADGQTFFVTFSGGLAQVNASNAHAKRLLEQADQALYDAKSAGRNCARHYTEAKLVQPAISKIKIIVVDDVYIIRHLIEQAFANLTVDEHVVVEIVSYSDGVSFLQSKWYEKTAKHIVLLDGMMPNMDGLDVLRAIRERYPSNEVIVSMLTGRKEEEYVRKALLYGADDYIVKPFNIADVHARIVQLIARLYVKR